MSNCTEFQTPYIFVELSHDRIGRNICAIIFVAVTMIIDVLVFVIGTKSNFQIILQNFDIRYFHYMTPYTIEHIATENFDSNVQHDTEN